MSARFLMSMSRFPDFLKLESSKARNLVRNVRANLPVLPAFLAGEGRSRFPTAFFMFFSLGQCLNLR